jgi:hypothetical protein
MFCASELVFDGTEGVGSCFHILRAPTRCRRYRKRRLTFSYFALPDSFSAVLMASAPVFMFYASGLIFGGTESVRSRFHVLRSRTPFGRNGWCRIPFSFFACPESFPAVPRVPGPVFMFCAPELVFDGTEGVGSRFHVLCSRTRFRHYRWHRLPFLCFALTDIFCGAECVGSRFHVLRARTRFRRLLRASAPVFMFCAPGLVLGITDGIGSRTHFLL